MGDWIILYTWHLCNNAKPMVIMTIISHYYSNRVALIRDIAIKHFKCHALRPDCAQQK